MYNLNMKIHRYWTQGENDTRVEYRFDSSVCKTCELMNKAERCIKTIKELASRCADNKFKRDIMKAIREAYK